MASSAVLVFDVPSAGITIRVKLLVDANPEVIEQVRAQLPLSTIGGHAVVSGHGFWLPTRIVDLGRGNMVKRKPGTVYLYAPGQLICLTYGDTTETAEVNQFGQVFEEDMPKLQQLGKHVYAKTITDARRDFVQINVRSEGDSGSQRPAGTLPSAIPEFEGNWREAKAILEAHINRIWLEMPKEIQKIDWGVIDSGAGTDGQYFSVLVHLEAYLMLGGASIIFRFLKLSQYDDMGLPLLITTTREFLLKTFNIFVFLTDLGITDMHEIGDMYTKALDSLTTKEEYLELTGSLLTLVVRYHQWIHFIFPWKLGVDAFPHRKPEEIHALSKILAAEEPDKQAFTKNSYRH